LHYLIACYNGAEIKPDRSHQGEPQMEKPNPIKALIFDFDGLILETEDADHQSWKELFEAYGGQLPFSKWATLIGTEEGTFDPALELEEQVGSKLDWERLKPQRYRRWLELIEERSIRPGVRQYLEDGKRMGFKIGLASCSPLAWLDRYLSRLSILDYFDVIRGKEHVRVTKPDPAIYLAALEALQVRAGQAIAFEDSPNGIHAAKTAGLFCIAVPSELTSILPLDQADLRMHSLADMSLESLLQLLEEPRI
jgi:HAD superfamily hydrolase (TIGR01509 family)